MPMPKITCVTPPRVLPNCAQIKDPMAVDAKGKTVSHMQQVSNFPASDHPDAMYKEFYPGRCDSLSLVSLH